MKITGNKKLIDKAIKKRNKLGVEFFRDENNSTLEEHYKNQTEIIFVVTWQDSMYNFNFVLRKVKERDDVPEIKAKKIMEPDRKNRRDIYILTEDNLKFEEVFYEVLNKLKEKYKEE